VKLSYIFYCN